MAEADNSQPQPSCDPPQPGPELFFELVPQMAAIASVRDRAWLRINPAFETAFGWKESDLQGQPVVRLVHPDDHHALNQALDSVSTGMLGAPVGLHILGSDGVYAATSWRVAATDQQALLFFGRSEGGADAEALRTQVNHLQAELQHQVRNTLAVVHAIIRRTSESGRSSDYVASHIQGRVQAFARVRSSPLAAGNGGVDLAALIAEELLAQSQREGDRLTIGGPDIALSPKAAESLSLAFHELAVNAIKYGALCAEGGRLEIGWRVDRGRLLLDWIESGVSLEAEEREEGFGMETLLRALPYELQGETEVRFTPTGLAFAMSVPLARVRAG